jgi:hypothetical protein
LRGEQAAERVCEGRERVHIVAGERLAPAWAVDGGAG